MKYLKLAIGNYQDSGNTTTIRVPLAGLAACLDRVGYEEGAGYASGHIARAWLPEFATAIDHLRSSLGSQRYTELAEQGATMTAAAIVAYANHQIDRVRTELEHPG